MIRNALRQCPICTGQQVEALHHQRFIVPEAYPLPDSYDVVCCDNCGFVYADSAATQQDYDAFYEAWSIYDHPQTAAGGGATPQDRDRLATTIEILGHWLPNRDLRMVDIGCATGGLLQALAQAGYSRLVGIDPSLHCVKETREKIGEAHQASIMDLPAANLGRFDCVLLSHVLEHVHDVRSAVVNLPQILKDGGVAYVELPDAARYADYVYAPFQDFNTEHINHFSLRSLDNLMGSVGFEPLGGGIRVQPASSSTFAPAFYGFYRLTGRQGGLFKDTNLRPAILRYIEISSELMSRIDDRIAEALRTSRELVVWGTGQLTLKLLAESRLASARVTAFADSNPVNQGRRLCGVPIVAPAEIRAYSQPVLIATLLHQNSILSDMKKLGLTNPAILLPEGGPDFLASRR